MTNLSRHIVVAIVAMAISGCAGLGPSAIKNSRGSYNIAVQQTGNEQLLLNIVRLKYRDNPMFLQLTSVTTSFAFETSAGADTIFKTGTDPVSVGAGITYTDKPTVTYTPLQGDKFVAEIMSPFELDTLMLLYHSGWSVERILALTAQQVNGLQNAPTASGPTPARKPRFEAFRQAVLLMRQLQVAGVMHMGAGGGDVGTLVMSIRPDAMGDPRVGELRTLLGLDKKQQHYPLVAGLGTRRDAINISLRSLIGVLFYVSQAVEVPARDVAKGRVTRTLDEKGEEFDWSQMLGALVRIRSSLERPENAYVAIPYRGAWFYIDDSDLTSKSTFALLTQLSALAAGGVKTSAPVLTLPIGN